MLVQYLTQKVGHRWSVSSFIISLLSGEVSELHQTEEAKAAARSLQAFVRYHHMYERWWSNPAQVRSRSLLPAEDSSPAGVKVNVVNGGLSESEESVCAVTGRSEELGFDASLLLSELHAAYQDTQRSVRDIQDRLAALVLQHSRSQGGQLDSDGPTGEASDIQASAGEQ